MSTESDIDKLSSVLSDFIKESSERLTRAEVHHENISDLVAKQSGNVNQLMEGVTAVIVSNSKLENQVASFEKQVVSLEKRAVSRLDVVETSTVKISARLSDIEMRHAHIDGKKESSNRIVGFFTKNWFNMLVVFGVILPYLAGMYNTIEQTKVDPATINKNVKNKVSK